MNNFSLLVVIIKKGKASKALKILKSIGATGGSIVYGEGSSDEKLSHFLEQNQIEKEILLSVISKDVEDKALEVLNNKFKLNKSKEGIAFIIPVLEVLGSKNMKAKKARRELKEMNYEAIFVIVEKDQGEKVISIAEKLGSKGATIIHGRGSGVHEQASIFNITIEPEKEIVMMLVKNSQYEDIMQGLSKKLNISEPGEGIIFSTAVSKAIGLVE